MGQIPIQLSIMKQRFKGFIIYIVQSSLGHLVTVCYNNYVLSYSNQLKQSSYGTMQICILYYINFCEQKLYTV